jgi:hypothetical protein
MGIQNNIEIMVCAHTAHNRTVCASGPDGPSASVMASVLSQTYIDIKR